MFPSHDRKAEIFRLVKDQDVVFNTVPGSISEDVQYNLLTSKAKLVIDTTFGNHNPYNFRDLCTDTTMIVDMGIAPGLSNMIAADFVEHDPEIFNVDIFVGGLPLERNNKWDFQATFNLEDLMSEYTRPAKVIRESKPCKIDAMSEIKQLTMGRLELEAFISDGLRTMTSAGS